MEAELDQAYEASARAAAKEEPPPPIVQAYRNVPNVPLHDRSHVIPTPAVGAFGVALYGLRIATSYQQPG